MNRFFATILLILPIASGIRADVVADIIDALERPVRFAAAVSTSSRHNCIAGQVVAMPNGDYIIDYNVDGRQEPNFIASLSDSIYAYNRGKLIRKSSSEGTLNDRAMSIWAPKELARVLRAQLADTAGYRITATSPELLTVHVMQDGTPCYSTIYAFDPKTKMPQQIIQRANDSDAEAVRTVFTPLETELPKALTPGYVQERFPETVVPRLPHTKLKDVHAARRVDLRDEATDAVVAVLDATDPDTPSRMVHVRNLASGRRIYWAFTDTKTEDILDICPYPSQGETVLSHASALGFKAPALIETQDSIITTVNQL